MKFFKNARMQRPRKQNRIKRKDKNMMYYLYVLNCSNGAIYVGTTNNPERRFIQHSSHRGAEWTKMNPPINVASVQPLPQVQNRTQLEFVESLHTIQLMKQYGWQRVRGGSFNRPSMEKTARMLKDPRNQRRYNYNSAIFGL